MEVRKRLEEWEQENLINFVNDCLERHEVGKIPKDEVCRLVPDKDVMDSWGRTGIFHCDKCKECIILDCISETCDFNYCPYCGRKAIK